MSTITPAQSPAGPPAAPPATLPPLHNGDRLTREEFLRRYDAMPNLKKAELIEGVVYMPSPVRQDRHSKQHGQIVTLAGNYSAATPGVELGNNPSLVLDVKNMPQPDVVLYIRPEAGGRAHVNNEGYIVGGPEWIAEVSASTVSNDLHDKLECYRRNGVREYLVWRVEDRAIDWFTLRGDRYERLQPDSDGLFKSAVFSGLRLDSRALLADDLPTVLKVVQQGVETPEHAAFVQQLEQIRRQKQA
ncbi:MAG: Uma2 family endonuclease [Gemmataceae bacterium]|nr:Uma2 family endonuclease [Gemmataceae bacterium]